MYFAGYLFTGNLILFLILYVLLLYPMLRSPLCRHRMKFGLFRLTWARYYAGYHLDFHELLFPNMLPK
ncbi:hypothetical protein BDZ94DRAFT_1243071 [Collybia nuda]|uniref:Uncharacterized protein n=1 Tax=Collybia nuda TaxID=64659 RepID=A0A9P6CPZ2_9AGAR|nr:hypothetical protein BDZ94DRAFT_1243071 [Collybia nuda]